MDIYVKEKSAYFIRDRLNDIYSNFKDIDALGVFLDNHDNNRFLNLNPNVDRLKNALTFVMFSRGIPIVYQGTEQGFHGSYDPYNREPIWTSKFDRNHDLYKFIAHINKIRNKMEVWKLNYVERYVSENIYAFSRGKLFIVTTNSDYLFE